MPFDPKPVLILAPQRTALPKAGMRWIRWHSDSDVLSHCLEELIIRMMMEARRIRHSEAPDLLKEIL